MFFIGIVSEEKNEKHIKDILKQKIENEKISIFIKSHYVTRYEFI